MLSVTEGSKLFSGRKDQVVRKNNSTEIRLQVLFKEIMKILIKNFNCVDLP